MKVDGHVHLWDSRLVRGGLPYPLPVAVASVDDLLRDMTANDVDRAVLVQPTPHGGDHSVLLSALTRFPDRFVGVGLVGSDLQGGDAQIERVRQIAELGLTGVRVHPLNNGNVELERIAREADRVGLSLELHVDESTWPAVFRVLEAAPDGAMVIDHFGRPHDPGGDAAQRFLKSLGDRPNVAVKVAAIDLIWGETYPYQNFKPWIETAMEQLGPERMFWGSNFPWSRGEQYSASIREITDHWGLSTSEREALFGGSAADIYGFEGGEK